MKLFTFHICQYRRHIYIWQVIYFTTAYISNNILICMFLSADVQGITFPRVTVSSQSTQQN